MDNKIVVWRHKTKKNIYLLRNWSMVGGGPESPFYSATTSFVDAVENFLQGQRNKEGFEYWMRVFEELTAKVILKKEMNFDGYTGILTKTVSYPVTEFEPVEFVEEDDG